MAREPVTTDAEALRDLCMNKAGDMDLGNHITVMNALHGLPEEHVVALRHMGYSEKCASNYIRIY